MAILSAHKHVWSIFLQGWKQITALLLSRRANA